MARQVPLPIAIEQRLALPALLLDLLSNHYHFMDGVPSNYYEQVPLPIAVEQQLALPALLLVRAEGQLGGRRAPCRCLLGPVDEIRDGYWAKAGWGSRENQIYIKKHRCVL